MNAVSLVSIAFFFALPNIYLAIKVFDSEDFQSDFKSQGFMHCFTLNLSDME